MKFSTAKYKCGGSIILLPCDIIDPNPNQPRKSFNCSELESLAISIQNNGIIQPLVVRRNYERYQLISGERRLRAAVMVGLITVPCIVMSVSDSESAVFAIIENLQRDNLSFFEEADAINNLITTFGLTQEQIARQLGKSQSTLSNKLRLLKLNPEVRTIISAHSLSERHARALLRLEDDDLQIKVLNKVINSNMNVIETDNYIDSLLKPSVIKSQPKLIKLKDIKIFVNTINHAVDTMQKAGIDAISDQHETDDYYEYVVRIPKKTTSPVDFSKYIGSA